MISRLHYFNLVVESGSFSEAARILDVQASSVSRQVVALEQELGVLLLNRTTRSLGLTEAGRKYYSYSQRIVADLDEAHQAVTNLQEQPKGVLRLSVTVAFGEYAVVPFLSSFMETYPDITVELELTERVVNLVEENIDLAIRSGKLADSNMVATKLMENHFILCASPEYLKSNGVPDSIESLKRFNCIRYGYAGWHNWYLLGDKPEKIEVLGNPVVNTVTSQHKLLLSHTGLALMPSWAVRDDLRSGRLVRVLEQLKLSPYPSESATYGVYLDRRFIMPKVRAFLDFIKKCSS
ncbi:LysR substrate-binding domain-containing protein [Endozoicomonas sp. Mp262]|uniref:LysR family transcriptional regulator n=1 Tax=Endozoicomonas sp. Mp262 TaxID=2919499 RepID=UPI0021D8F454